jgi:hypothetical protein
MTVDMSAPELSRAGLLNPQKTSPTSSTPKGSAEFIGLEIVGHDFNQPYQV